jgi:ABC-type branched-subunit amino acid transport system substrate-binding protein
LAIGGAVVAGPVLSACGDDDDDGGGGGGGGTVKIGVLAPITGALAPYGAALKNGMEVAAELINKDGGFGNRKVEYVLADDRTDPKTATTQARKLLVQDRVDFLMGTISSATTLAVIPQAESAGKPYFYIVEGEDKTCDDSGGTRKLIFGNGETPEQKMTKFVPYMLENLGKRIYFIGSDYVFPHFVTDITSGLVKENGGEIAGTAYAPLGTTDFSSYISKVRAADPEVLFVEVVGTDGIALVKQLSQFGLDKKLKITGIPSFAPEVFGGIGPVAQGVYTVERYWDGVDNDVNKRFVEAYRAKFGSKDPVSTTSAQGAYGTLQLYKAAVEKADSTEADAVAEALPGVSVESPAGQIEVSADNHIVIGPERLLQIEGDGYRLVKDLGEASHKGHSGCSSKDI